MSIDPKGVEDSRFTGREAGRCLRTLVMRLSGIERCLFDRECGTNRLCFGKWSQ